MHPSSSFFTTLKLYGSNSFITVDCLNHHNCVCILSFKSSVALRFEPDTMYLTVRLALLFAGKDKVANHTGQFQLNMNIILITR